MFIFYFGCEIKYKFFNPFLQQSLSAPTFLFCMECVIEDSNYPWIFNVSMFGEN